MIKLDGVVVEQKHGFPYGIGCVRGGASWNIILTMIEEVLKDRNVIIYKYEEILKCIK